MGIVALNEPDADPVAAKPHLEAFATWQTSVVEPKVRALKAMKKRSTAEDTLLHDLQEIDTGLSALTAGWRKATGRKTPRKADVASLDRLATAFVQKVFDAQAHLEGEKDPHRVEAGVKAAFKKEATKQ